MAAEHDPAPDRAADPTAARPTGAGKIEAGNAGPGNTGIGNAGPGSADAGSVGEGSADGESGAVAAAPPGGFAGWRGRRPFWGGLMVALAGAEILLTEKAPMRMMIRIGLLGLAGYVIPVLMVLCGLLLIFHPVQRVFYSLLSVLATLGSWVTSNLGGFFIGLLLGLIGSTLAFGWLPDQPRRAGRRARRAERRATPA
ncbi:DUF6114 domain-containing protein [Kitasatospora sp. NPDC088391]|uniref:DUF6114 domain-containing protein n=1 Tax=Kitasatospora sp. NPDC088391 TaxID=3364074 RepID=UPI0037F4252C